jgi:putative addiction module component (TIGR02574 family)
LGLFSVILSGTKNPIELCQPHQRGFFALPWMQARVPRQHAQRKVELLGRASTFLLVSMTLKELYAEARQLPREQAAELMDLLLIDTFSAPDTAVEAAWGREIDRRLAELDSGKVQAIPGEQVMAEIRKIVGL